MIPQYEMNRPPSIPADNMICVDGRNWDISNLLMSTCHLNESINFTAPPSPSTLTASNQSSLRSSQHHSNRMDYSSSPSPEMSDSDIKIESKTINHSNHNLSFGDDDEKEYEKEYYFNSEDEFLYPRDRPETPPSVDEIFRRPRPLRRNIADFDILPSYGITTIHNHHSHSRNSSHSNCSFAISRGSHESDDDDCSALTFNDDGSVHSQQQQALPQTPPPIFTPSRPRPLIEVMPNQFLPLRGSDETMFYVEHGFCREARCLYCCTNQYFIQDVTMVMCPGCRLIFAPEKFGFNSENLQHASGGNSNGSITGGSLGLGLRVDEADAIFRQLRQVPQRRNRLSPPPPSGGPVSLSLQKTYSQTSLISAAVAAAAAASAGSSHGPNDNKSYGSAAASTTTARNLLMRRQASLSRFRGSQHSKRSTISEGSRAA